MVDVHNNLAVGAAAKHPLCHQEFIRLVLSGHLRYDLIRVFRGLYLGCVVEQCRPFFVRLVSFAPCNWLLEWVVQIGLTAEDTCLPSGPPKSEYTVASL